MTLLDKVAILCGQRKMPLRQLEREAGLKERTIQHWDKSVPSADKVVKVARVLQVPIEELFSVYDESGDMLRIAKTISEYGEVSAMDITEREKGILLCFRLLNSEGQDRAEEYINMLVEGDKFKRFTPDMISSGA